VGVVQQVTSEGVLHSYYFDIDIQEIFVSLWWLCGEIEYLSVIPCSVGCFKVVNACHTVHTWRSVYVTVFMNLVRAQLTREHTIKFRYAHKKWG